MFSSNNDLRPYCRQANLARFALIVASVMALIVGDTANAELIRINMTGTIEVNNEDGLLPDEFVTGTPFTGQFTYDTDVQDIIPENADRGVFTYAAGAPGIGISLNMAGYAIESDSSSPIQIQLANDIAETQLYQLPVAGDSFVVSRAQILSSGFPSSLPVGSHLWSTSQGIPLNSQVGNADTVVLEIRFLDPSGGALSDSVLPVSFASESFETMEIVVWGARSFGTRENPSPSFFITANIDAVSFEASTVAVPEPSSLYLIASGMFMYGLGRVLRSRKA